MTTAAIDCKRLARALVTITEQKWPEEHRYCVRIAGRGTCLVSKKEDAERVAGYVVADLAFALQKALSDAAPGVEPVATDG